MSATKEARIDPIDPDELAAHVRAVRLGHGANCSSVGSVIDTLFLSAVVGGAIFTAVAAALAREKARVVGAGPKVEREEPAEAQDPTDGSSP